MTRTIRCGFCGRENPIDYTTCSNCGLRLRKPFEEVKQKEAGGKEESKLTLEELEESMKKQQADNWIFWKPTEQKLMIFFSLVFTTLWLPLVVKYQIIFALLYYLTLYWFSCRWILKAGQSSEKSIWQDFILQFILLVFAFFLTFRFLLS